jgi:hypothetical protein
MGSNQSSAITEAISEYNQNVNNVTQNITNASSASCSVVQNVTVTNNAPLYGCTFDIDEIAANVCNLAASAASTSNADLISELQSAVQATAAATQSADNDFLSTTFANQGQNTTINQAIQNVVQNNITTNDLTTCVAQANLDQNGSFVNNAPMYCAASNPVITFTSNAQQQLIGNCLSNAVIGAVSQDTAVMNAITAATSTQGATSKGLGDVISSALSAYEYIILGVLCVVCIIIFGVLIFAGYILLSPAGQQSLVTATNAAATAVNTASASAGKASLADEVMLAFRSARRFRSRNK